MALGYNEMVMNPWSSKDQGKGALILGKSSQRTLIHGSSARIQNINKIESSVPCPIINISLKRIH